MNTSTDDIDKSYQVIRTTLEKEMEKLKKAIVAKMSGFSVPDFPKVEQIMRIFARHSKTKKISSIAPSQLEKMKKAISSALSENRPIPIGLLWSVGGQALHPLKLFQWDINLPRLGDIWGLYFFSLIDKKIRTIYSEGCEIVIVDEQPQLEILGMPTFEILQRRKALEKLIPKGLNMRIMPLPCFKEEVKKISHSEPAVHPVFTILTCLPPRPDFPSDVLRNVMRSLYKVRDKNWAEIIAQIPSHIWQETKEKVIKMNKIWQARKDVDWMQEQVFQGLPYVDCSLTEKDRWNPDPWGYALPQHGGSVLSYNEQGRFSIKVIPEHRLQEQGYIPVYIDASEFGLNHGKEFIFYWVERTER